VFHSIAYSSLSALLNIVKSAEQTQLCQIIADENLDLIGTIVEFVYHVGYFFFPSSQSFTKPAGRNDTVSA
jgi:hypothetical protein